MLPICRPVKPSDLLRYAPNEMSHAPQTKNCMKFITVRRNRMLMERGFLLRLVFLEERGADPAHEAHEDRGKESGPEGFDLKVRKDESHEAEHRGVNHEQEETERHQRHRQ